MSAQVLKWEFFDAGAEPTAAEAAAGEREDRPEADAPVVPEPEPAPAQALDALLARAKGEGRAAGFEEGVAHAEAQGRAELRVILTELREALQDAVHARLVREAETLAAARRLAEALLAGVAPELARRGLAAELAAAAAEALSRDGARGKAAGPRPLARVAPDRIEAVRRAFAEAALDLEIEPDPALGPLSARLEWAEGEDAIDLDAALDAARAALERHLPDAGGCAASREEGRRPAHG